MNFLFSESDKSGTGVASKEELLDNLLRCNREAIVYFSLREDTLREDLESFESARRGLLTREELG